MMVGCQFGTDGERAQSSFIRRATGGGRLVIVSLTTRRAWQRLTAPSGEPIYVCSTSAVCGASSSTLRSTTPDAGAISWREPASTCGSAAASRAALRILVTSGDQTDAVRYLRLHQPPAER